jgi:hypothetical protein
LVLRKSKLKSQSKFAPQKRSPRDFCSFLTSHMFLPAKERKNAKKTRLSVPQPQQFEIAAVSVSIGIDNPTNNKLMLLSSGLAPACFPLQVRLIELVSISSSGRPSTF